jgi:hypothetical protein
VKVAKNWYQCDVKGCDKEVLRHRASDAGWLVTEFRQLCPVHRVTHGPVLDAARRAAGDRE